MTEAELAHIEAAVTAALQELTDRIAQLEARLGEFEIRELERLAADRTSRMSFGRWTMQ